MMLASIAERERFRAKLKNIRRDILMMCLGGFVFAKVLPGTCPVAGFFL